MRGFVRWLIHGRPTKPTPTPPAGRGSRADSSDGCPWPPPKTPPLPQGGAPDSSFCLARARRSDCSYSQGATMVQLSQLWLPIVLSAVTVFIGSSIIWMALPIHKHEYKKLGDKEPAVLDAVRSWGLGGGMFMFPFCDPKDRNSPQAKEKSAKGPWGVMMLRDKPWSMGPLMAMWFINLLLISAVVAYIGRHAG